MLLIGIFVWVLVIATIELFLMGVVVGYFQKKFITKDIIGFGLGSILVTLFLGLGFFLGCKTADFMPDYTTWYAATILFILGLKQFYDGIKLHKTKQLINPLDIKGLLILCVLAGLNVFFIGVVFGLLQMISLPIYLSFLLFLLAILLGHVTGFRIRKLPSLRFEFISGVVFILVAVLITIYF